jgi:FtsP/CotA-like multicopper oxidase with cupredoxin domain
MTARTSVPSRRQFLKGAVVLGGLGVLGVAGAATLWPSGENPPAPAAAGQPPTLDALATR